VSFIPVRFTPDTSVFAKQECHGVRFQITDREKFHPVDLGILLATTLHRDYPDTFGLEMMATLLGDKPTLIAIRISEPLAKIRRLWTEGLELYEKRRQPHLLYPR